MKPNFLSDSEYARLCESGRRVLREQRAPLTEKMVDLCAAGDWLDDQLAALGADEKDREDTCTSFGQACFGREPWATAQSVLELWKQDRAPKPGPEFAAQLVTGEADGLPPGGVFIIEV